MFEPKRCHYRVLGVSLCCFFLSGSLCRLPPGSAGHLRASLHILYPGHLCICGSALHSQQRKEVHHLWHLSIHRLWVYINIYFLILRHVFASSCLILGPHSHPTSSPIFQACASWSQPPSTPTASIWMRPAARTVTATSWRGSPSLSRSSPRSLTLCYVRRLHEKDTSSIAPTSPKSPSTGSTPPTQICPAVYVCPSWASDLSCRCRFGYTYGRPVDLSNVCCGLTEPRFHTVVCTLKVHWATHAFEGFEPHSLGWISWGHLRIKNS